MLQVKTTNGQNVTDSNEDITVNYVLEYNKESFIRDYGEDDYKFYQKMSGLDTKLDVLCRYIYCDEDDCYSSQFSVVYSNRQFYLIVWKDEGANVIQLPYKSIKEVHNFVFSIME